MALPDVRAWTPAAKTASSLESLRLISDDCAAKGNMFFFFFKSNKNDSLCDCAEFYSECVQTMTYQKMLQNTLYSFAIQLYLIIK